MSLIFLAIFLSVALCFIALRFAIFAMPFMVGLSAFRAVSAPDSGWLLPILAALGAAILALGLIIAIRGFTKNPFLRLAAAAAFAIPAMVAGYALMHGLAKNVLDPGLGLTLLCGVSGFCVGIAAIVNLSAVGEMVFES